MPTKPTPAHIQFSYAVQQARDAGRDTSQITSAYTDAQLAEMCIALRDQKAAINKRAKQLIADADAAAAVIQAHYLTQMNASGMTSMSGKGWRVTRKTTTRYTPTDTAALHAFILQTGDLSLLQNRIATTAVREYNDLKGELPPGIDASHEYTVSVYRK